MTKKFKTDLAEQPLTTPIWRLSLQDYIASFAPEVLHTLPIMQGSNPLHFWQNHFEPPTAGEGKRWQQDSLRWPYAERLVYLAREFTKLDDRCRQYILKAAQAKIWWRGDDIHRFRIIVAAQQSYRRLSQAEQEQYRQKLMIAARGFPSYIAPDQ